MAAIYRRIVSSMVLGRQSTLRSKFISPHKYIATTSAVLSGECSPRGPSYVSSLSEATLAAKMDIVPIYRILDQQGQIVNKEEEPNLSDDTLLSMYTKSRTLQILDQYLYRAQRMGLISFYMTNMGEEGIHFGSAAALTLDDVIYAQYREAGVLIWRGFTIDNIMNQCFGNSLDPGKGRQMPVHYGSKKLNFHYISSPLGTQIPQAPGYAYGLKMAGSKDCVICYFGDGAAQEGDCHAAMNFAATLSCPVVFICRNNGYAISTPIEDQYAGDGLVRRGIGYGMEAIRVDGNDVLAMYNATKYARDTSVEEKRPFLIEAMTLRLGSHSTSDDQSLYQEMDQVEYWTNHLHPVSRLKLYLMNNRGIWDEEKEEEYSQSIDKEIKDSFQRARNIKKPAINEMFTDVYDAPSKRLLSQQEELGQHLRTYGKHYPIDKYE